MPTPSLVGTPSFVAQTTRSSRWNHSHVLPSGGGSNRRLIICIQINHHSAVVNWVKYGSINVPIIATIKAPDDKAQMVFCEMVESDLAILSEGNSYTLTVDFESDRKGETSIHLIRDVNKSVATAIATNEGTGTVGSSPTSFSTSITPSRSNSLILDFPYWDDQNASGDPGTNQTKRYDKQNPSGIIRVASSYKSGYASPTTMSWNNPSTGGFGQWAHAVFVFAPMTLDYVDDSTGNESYFTKKAKLISDTSVGGDAYQKTIVRKKNFVDVAVGIETFFTQEPLKKDYADTATGLDSIIIPKKSKIFGDVGTGSALFVSIQPLKKSYFDVAVGDDVFSISGGAKVYSDFGIGNDVYSLQKTQIFSDTAIGSDKMYKFCRKLNTKLDREDPVILFELYDD